MTALDILLVVWSGLIGVIGIVIIYGLCKWV